MKSNKPFKHDKTQQLFLEYLADSFDVDDVKTILNCPVRDKGLMYVTMVWGMVKASKILNELTGSKTENLENLFTDYLRGEVVIDEDLL